MQRRRKSAPTYQTIPRQQPASYQAENTLKRLVGIRCANPSTRNVRNAFTIHMRAGRGASRFRKVTLGHMNPAAE